MECDGKKKDISREGIHAIRNADISEYKTANTSSKRIFIDSTHFSISVIKRVLEC